MNFSPAFFTRSSSIFGTVTRLTEKRIDSSIKDTIETLKGWERTQITQLKKENPRQVFVSRTTNHVEVTISKFLSSVPRTANDEFLPLSQIRLGFFELFKLSEQKTRRSRVDRTKTTKISESA
jgi:hypothetical protein